MQRNGHKENNVMRVSTGEPQHQHNKWGYFRAKKKQMSSAENRAEMTNTVRQASLEIGQ